jgi:hypothetical protein
LRISIVTCSKKRNSIAPTILKFDTISPGVVHHGPLKNALFSRHPDQGVQAKLARRTGRKLKG